MVLLRLETERDGGGVIDMRQMEGMIKEVVLYRLETERDSQDGIGNSHSSNSSGCHDSSGKRHKTDRR